MTGFLVVRSTFIAAGLIAAVMGSTHLMVTQDFADVRAVVEFQRAADAYAFLHRQVERRLGQAHQRAGRPADVIEAAELATAIVGERSSAQEGALFTTPVAAALRRSAAKAARANGCNPGELRSGAWTLRQVNTSATGTTPLNPCIANALPALPDELEYRSAGTVLVLVDSHANLIVDILPALLAGRDLRH
jgi:hypothetical protein